MKKIAISVLITGLISITNIVHAAQCTYNFNATQNEITAYDSSLLKFPTIVGQTASFNIGIDSGVKSYMAVSSQYLNTNRGDISTPNTGIFAYEYKFKVPNYVLPSGEALAFFPLGGVGFDGSSSSLIIFGAYTNNTASLPNENTLKIYINDLSAEKIELPITTTAGGYQRLGVYINQTTKQVGLIFNGVDKGYLGSFPNKLDSFAFINIGAQYGVTTGSPTIGTNVSIELVTDHTALNFTYPAGTKDICGNVI